MTLSTFISANMERILAEWEAFARSLDAASSRMGSAALRDHAELMLRAIAADIETKQSPAQESAKSKGHAPTRPAHLPVSAATSHGTLRADEGFSLEEMVSEYRALRASVLRMWLKQEGVHGPERLDELMRFNEAIDEALADSIETYSYAIDNMFETKARRRMEDLGTLSAGLGHDMANALQTMRMCLEVLTRQGVQHANAPVVDALGRAVVHLTGLTKGLRALSSDPDDRLTSPDFTVLSDWWASAISPFTWALPKGVQLHVQGLSSAEPALPAVRVPAHALMQVVFNLVQNSAQALGQHNGANTTASDTSHASHARATGNIWVTAGLEPDSGGTRAVRLTVRDDGPGMDAATVSRCTDAFFTTKPKHMSSGLGLALVRNAAERYGGKLLIESELGKGCLFTLLLPVEATGERTKNLLASHAATDPIR